MNPRTQTQTTDRPATPLDPNWVFLSFVHRYFHFEEVVGGEHVRPFELFNALADAGHDVRVYERHNHDGEERRFGGLVVRPLPVPGRRTLRRLLFWPTLYAVFFAELLAARKRGRRLCLYQTLPWGALDWRRLELVPAYVLFWMAGRIGAATWGAIHDLPYDHFEYGRTLDEQNEKTDEERRLARRAAGIQLDQVRHARFVTVVSRNMKQAVVERSAADPRKVHVFRSAVNPRHMVDIPEWEPPVDRPWRIGFLGNAADAQLPLLIEAIDHVEADVELLLAGHGTPALQQTFDVRCFGDVRYKDFAAFARELDVWVIPFGAPLDYLETTWQLKPPMNVASGRPVVMTETSETKHSGLEPFLFLCGTTPASIAERIDAVVRDPGSSARRAAAGRAYLLGEMTWRHVAGRLVDRLNEVVAPAVIRRMAPHTDASAPAREAA